MGTIETGRPAVSVLIDTYNQGRFIEEAVNSVLSQSFPLNDMEILVVDDGSTDDTRKRLESYGDQIRYVYKENGGQASALNAGFSHARGRYVLLLDADDYWMPDKVNQVVREFERYSEVALVLNGRRIIWDVKSTVERRPEFHNLKLALGRVGEFRKLSYWTSTSALRMSVLKSILPIPESIKLVADVYLSSVIWFGNVSRLGDPLTVYRVHRDNLFSTRDSKKIPSAVCYKRLAIDEMHKKISSLPNYDEKLFQAIVKPDLIGAKYLEVCLAIEQKQSGRKELLSVEVERMAVHWKDWRVRRKILMMIKLALIAVLPLRWTVYLRQY